CDGNDLVCIGDLGRQHFHDVRFDVDLVQIDRLHADLGGQCKLQVLLVDISQVDQDLTDGTALGLLKLEGLVNLVAVHLAHADQYAAQRAALVSAACRHHGGCCGLVRH